MGVQSFDDGILKWMNRRHTAERAVRAYHILEDAGVENISIDLIFGLSQMSEAQWRETLDKALNISSRGALPKHISAYQLSVETDSMLEKLIAKGRWEEASEEVCERQYEVLCEVLAAAGYNHYEISNFAQPGYEAVHNSAYWRHVPYIGLGPGAHSCLEGCAPMALRRQWNKADLKAYMEAAGCGDFSAVQEGEALDAEQIVLERIMLGLRTAAGVPEVYLREHCQKAELEEAFRCLNLVTLENGNVRIPENRFFVSDNIIAGIV
jgi:oxygen-independent coproporphyrinogen-3 oxidase